MEKNWIIKPAPPEAISEIQKEFKLPEIYARIMALRGISSRADSRNFFFADMTQLHDPFLMKDMDRAVEKALTAIDSKKSVLIFGDYDVDGTTGTSMLYLFFKALYVDVHFYIPNREIEGYGVSIQGIDYAHSIGATLMITCDCGINAFHQVEYANSLGIEVIITDHHKPDKKLPDAFAILNPNQTDCSYPFKGLCGAGVAFKLALAICEKRSLDPQIAWKHADLIALGTAADLVPITGENRIIVSYGLKLIQEGHKVGFQSLLKTSGMKDTTINVGKLVFWIAPKINAAGRLGDAARAVKLLTSDNPVYAMKLAKELERENIRRQDITRQVVDEAVLMINTECNLENDHAIVLANDRWHQGVIGIVASRIRELYNRPVFIISVENGIGKGSGRSISSFDLYDTLNSCEDLLIGFGGHPIAAGLSVEEDKIDEFRRRFIQLANQNINKEKLVPHIYVDGELAISQIDGRFIKFLESMSPYGPGNMRPKFICRKLQVNGMPRVLGKDRDTIKFNVNSGRGEFEAIGFKMIDQFEKLLLNRPIDIAFEIGENHWNGSTTIQLEVKDIKLG